MPKIRVKPPGKKPLPDYQKAINELNKYMNNPDRKDYQRTIAGRGDTHALDGGKIPASKTKRGKKLKQMQKKFPPALPVWQDRNSSNQGTKLNP